MKTFCKKCHKETESIVKMSGLICSNCIVIKQYPDSHEFKEALKEINEVKSNGDLSELQD